MNDIEEIKDGIRVIGYVIRKSLRPTKTMFITSPESKQQIGFIVYPKNGVIKRHRHRHHERRIFGMSEVLVVRSGHSQIDVYDDKNNLIATRDLYEGDIVLILEGGHGFSILEDAIFIEIKQGPYLGVNDKEFF